MPIGPNRYNFYTEIDAKRSEASIEVNKAEKSLSDEAKKASLNTVHKKIEFLTFLPLKNGRTT
ncbi:hypothetical protein K8353_48880, partial [Burkholderia contaminans]|nr:hypothetical protein [Burkholderia contaminans]